ncbi:MAG: hypothetical protein US86_C0007G0100 [Candidatus Daviesbacteria bacterium GW2011_GWA2_38_24]|uniref:ASCH domain-containing protein n=1 Tax=Candidatus Daviesbacteria bacterium GW2011_GWA2_38_24 TaxID=1618422 RepID=A0A0G0JSF0_9BACT|nr:MAG: hypothetical protein US86_C0007G0100 [Candidatus Daviesbacteria bacterium GW2011_GWA2_38_24]KKQ78778.1 MAG: hypothetical protein UT01_C0060G0012 [Candidatus Daviesbacteria bacterium GW2011_GWA1_38_7]
MCVLYYQSYHIATERTTEYIQLKMKKHLAIFTPNAVKQILEGKKTIETRFSQKRIAPFGSLSVGDIVYIKPSGKDVVGQFVVKKILYFEGLSTEDWLMIKGYYGKNLSLGSGEADEQYFKSKELARFGTIIYIGRVEQFITSPISIQKSDQRGWVVLEE